MPTNSYLVFDSMSWPDPASEHLQTIAWQCRYAPSMVRPEDLLILASVFEAYCQLVAHPQVRRNQIAGAIKRLATTKATA